MLAPVVHGTDKGGEMELLTLDEIKQGLEQEFLPLEPMLTGFRLIDGGVSDEALNFFEHQLGTKLPENFRDLVKKFDFGHLTIGPIVFCNTGDYLQELTEFNSRAKWWGEGLRPQKMLMVANSDPYFILLNVETEELFAGEVELGWQCAKRVAKGFNVYLRCIGTAMLNRNIVDNDREFAEAVMHASGGTDLDYWSQLIN